MSQDSIGDVTQVLQEVAKGVPGAQDRLMALVYDRLKAIARNRAGKSWSDPLEPTALVNETYLRLFGSAATSWENRNHFFWAAARSMRDILVERAKHACTAKNNGGIKPSPLSDHPITAAAREPHELLELDEAIRRLEAEHPDIARIVILRVYAELDREQLAEVTGLSAGAVWRRWEFGRAWLQEALEADSKQPPRAGRRDLSPE